MARRGRPAPQGPVYEDAATAMAAAIPLDYPFSLDGVRYDGFALLPPTFGSLQTLRALPVIDGADVLAAFEIPPSVVHAMRWPDVDALLGVAVSLLPPDLAAALVPAEPTVAPEPEPVAKTKTPPGFPEVDGPVDWDGSPGDIGSFLHDPVRIDRNG